MQYISDGISVSSLIYCTGTKQDLPFAEASVPHSAPQNPGRGILRCSRASATRDRGGVHSWMVSVSALPAAAGRAPYKFGFCKQ